MRIKASRALAPSLLTFGLVLSGLACTGQRPARTDGERLYLSRCTSCHSAYEPREYQPHEWDHAIGRMLDLNKVKLTHEERALIFSYLAGTERRLPRGPLVQHGTL